MNATICPREDCHRPDPEPDPIDLPDRETLAKAIHASGVSSGMWADLVPNLRESHHIADDVLAFLRESVTCWEPIDPADIKVGMRLRMHQGGAHVEFVVKGVYETHLSSGGLGYWGAVLAGRTWEVDPRTLPAEPEDPRVEVLAEEMEAECPHCDDAWPCSGAERFRGAARRAIARLNAIGGEQS